MLGNFLLELCKKLFLLYGDSVLTVPYVEVGVAFTHVPIATLNTRQGRVASQEKIFATLNGVIWNMAETREVFSLRVKTIVLRTILFVFIHMTLQK